MCVCVRESETERKEECVCGGGGVKVCNEEGGWRESTLPLVHSLR